MADQSFFARVPTELFDQIFDCLGGPQHIANMAQTCKEMYRVLRPRLLALAKEYALPASWERAMWYSLGNRGERGIVNIILTKPRERMVEAITRNNTQSLEFMLEAGVSPDSLTLIDKTMLTMAAEHGQLGATKLLLQYGAQPSLTNPADSLEPLDHVALTATEVACLLIEKSGGIMTPKIAERVCHMEEGRAIFDRFPMAYRMSFPGGATILHVAARCPAVTYYHEDRSYNSRVVAELVDGPASQDMVNARNAQGKTPLRVAMDAGQEENASLLAASFRMRKPHTPEDAMVYEFNFAILRGWEDVASSLVYRPEWQEPEFASLLNPFLRLAWDFKNYSLAQNMLYQWSVIDQNVEDEILEYDERFGDIKSDLRRLAKVVKWCRLERLRKVEDALDFYQFG